MTTKSNGKNEQRQKRNTEILRSAQNDGGVEMDFVQNDGEFDTDFALEDGEASRWFAR